MTIFAIEAALVAGAKARRPIWGDAKRILIDAGAGTTATVWQVELIAADGTITRRVVQAGDMGPVEMMATDYEVVG